MTDEIISAMERYSDVEAARAAEADNAVECPRCGGSGRRSLRRRCSECRGFGKVSPDSAKMINNADRIYQEEEELIHKGLTNHTNSKFDSREVQMKQAESTLKIKAESDPERCEMCHQKDQFDRKTGICGRCNNMAVPLSLQVATQPIRRSRGRRDRFIALAIFTVMALGGVFFCASVENIYKAKTPSTTQHNPMLHPLAEARIRQIQLKTIPEIEDRLEKQGFSISRTDFSDEADERYLHLLDYLVSISKTGKLPDARGVKIFASDHYDIGSGTVSVDLKDTPEKIVSFLWSDK